MNRHSGPSRTGGEAAIPEPSLAERARTLAYLGRTGTLATSSRRHGGHPFASVMPYALDDVGRTLFLISAIAMHTQNLESDPRTSLLITQPDWSGDPLAGGRVTLMGEAVKLSVADSAEARSIYLARHQRAGYWADFNDFGFWRLDIADVYFVGGFAAMGWVTADDYARARSDPLADAASSVAEHMNRDHADALVSYARYYAGVVVDQATMVSVDRLGFKLRLTCGDCLSSVRIAFPREVTSIHQCRGVMSEMLLRIKNA